jgi:hypothetical protein
MSTGDKWGTALAVLFIAALVGIMLAFNAHPSDPTPAPLPEWDQIETCMYECGSVRNV